MSTNAGRRRATPAAAQSPAPALDRHARPAATSRPGPSARSASISLFDVVAHRADARPLREQRVVAPGARVAVGLDEDRRRRRPAPNTFHASSAVKLRNGAIQRSIACVIVPERGLRRAPRRRLRRGGVEAVLQHVEVERAEVFAAEDLQLGDHRMELVDLVVAAAKTPVRSSCRRSRPAARPRAPAPSGRSRAARRAAPRRAPGRSRWCWRAGSAACCGCAGRRRPRGRGSCRRSARSPE